MDSVGVYKEHQQPFHSILLLFVLTDTENTGRGAGMIQFGVYDDHYLIAL